MNSLEIRLPENVMSIIPSEKGELISFLSSYVEKHIIAEYEEEFRKRVSGPMGQPLSRFEKAILKDFVISLILGKLGKSGM